MYGIRDPSKGNISYVVFIASTFLQDKLLLLEPVPTAAKELSILCNLTHSLREKCWIRTIPKDIANVFNLSSKSAHLFSILRRYLLHNPHIHLNYTKMLYRQLPVCARIFTKTTFSRHMGLIPGELFTLFHRKIFGFGSARL